MSALFSHAIRWEWAEKNPIRSVRQSAKRLRTPDVLTPEEIVALLGKLPEPLRTAVELDAFTGLRRGELIGLQWQDVERMAGTTRLELATSAVTVHLDLEFQALSRNAEEH
jgi:integrase